MEKSECGKTTWAQNYQRDYHGSVSLDDNELELETLEPYLVMSETPLLLTAQTPNEVPAFLRSRVTKWVLFNAFSNLTSRDSLVAMVEGLDEEKLAQRHPYDPFVIENRIGGLPTKSFLF